MESRAEHGPGRPVLLLDLTLLDQNLATVRRLVSTGLALRVVAKSLPSAPLLRYVQSRLETQRLMVFDDSLTTVATEFPESDILLGKPLRPRRRLYMSAPRAASTAPPGERIAWLVDSPERLTQYASLARGTGVRMRIVIEIDVGLHRGGVATPEDLTLLDLIARDLGLLPRSPASWATDAHVTSAPPCSRAPGSARSARSSPASRAFEQALFARDPAWLSSCHPQRRRQQDLPLVFCRLPHQRGLPRLGPSSCPRTSMSRASPATAPPSSSPPPS
ncbi:MAG: alanine racemase [Polyangiaceae bacterium]